MKFVVLGKYSTQGLAGFVKNPSDNRQEAAKKITEAAGGKLLEMMTLRGAYDFIAIIEGSDFETMAGMKMLMQSTGTIEDMNIMEAVDFNKAAEKAAKAASAALETRWIALLLKLYSEPHRAVRGNLEFLARMYTFFDIYGKVLSDKDKNLDNVTSAAQRVSKTFVSERTGMELAIWFCNAVRNPRSHTNEEDSVKLFQQFAAECALPEKETRIINTVHFFTKRLF